MKDDFIVWVDVHQRSENKFYGSRFASSNHVSARID